MGRSSAAPRVSSAILVAAGSGERFGSPAGKAFARLAERPLVAHSLAALDDVDEIGEIVVVLRPADLERFDAEYPAGARSRKIVAVVPGGAVRQDSVRAGLANLGRDATVVVVHDAARPLVTAALARRCLAALEDGVAGVVPALPIGDTLKRVDGDHVRATLDRASLVGAQTPQVFRRRVLEEVHRRAADAPEAATDDAALVERAGETVRWIEGDPSNIKVTWPSDIVLAEALLAARRSAAGKR